MKRLAFAVLPVLALAAPAQAWDANAHKVIGVIAYRHLTPKAKAWCDGMLQTLPEGYRTFLDAAPYPDYFKHGGPKDKPPVRVNHKFDGWHFIDLPVKDGQTSTAPYDLSLESGADTVLYGIGESVQSMRTGLAETRGTYLAMLIHLVGDAHQPLHCAERDGDKGGNDVPIVRPSVKELHAYWDDAMTIKYRMRSVAAHSDEKIERVAGEIEAACPLTDSRMAKDAADLDPKDWVAESYALAVTCAYQGIKAGEAPSEAYEARLIATSERRVALAGYRLANLLNALASKR